MSKRLDDIEDDLTPRLFSTTSWDYYSSICLKYYFAKKRIVNLKKKITNYKSRIEFRNCAISFPDTSSIDMDLDHCIISLRSSLEHLAQLINSVVPLKLKTTGYGRDVVSLQRVIDKIDCDPKFKNDSNLLKLSAFLRNEVDEDWYKELHKLRIENYHHRSRDTLNHSSARTDPNKMDELFLMPQDVVSAKTNKDREICHYCQNMINNIERVLYNSFCLISGYLPKRGV